jgi:5-hydroxyisourate hydrolase-like protein (transthyretin family)
MLLLFLALALAGCSGVPEAPQSAEAEPETLSRTEFTGRIENFFEYEPLRSGRPSRFLIHLTDLSDGAPVEKAEVKLIARSAGSPSPVAETVGKAGRVTGIYVAELTLARPGEYEIEFHIGNAKLDERMLLSDFEVSEP